MYAINMLCDSFVKHVRVIIDVKVRKRRLFIYKSKSKLFTKIPCLQVSKPQLSAHKVSSLLWGSLRQPVPLYGFSATSEPVLSQVLHSRNISQYVSEGKKKIVNMYCGY